MRPARPAMLATALVAVTATALAGCASADNPPNDETGQSADSPQLPDGWHWAEGADIPSVEAEPELPVTVTDSTGTEVEIDDADRIIVGGDDVAAILDGLGLGDLVYAAPTNSADETAMNAPVQFEYSQDTGAEGLLAVDGTLFIGNNPKRHGSVAAQFNQAGIDAVVLDDQQSVPDKIRDIGEYLGVPDAAGQLAADVEAQLAEAGEVAAGTDLSDVRILQVTSNGAGGANAVVGSGTAGADIATALGAVSVGVDSGMRGYSVEFSDEGLLDAAPDVILLGTADLEEWADLAGFGEAFPTLIDTPAGQAGNIVVMPSEQIKVSGPATGSGALALAETIVDLVR